MKTAKELSDESVKDVDRSLRTGFMYAELANNVSREDMAKHPMIPLGMSVVMDAAQIMKTLTEHYDALREKFIALERRCETLQMMVDATDGEK